MLMPVQLPLSSFIAKGGACLVPMTSSRSSDGAVSERACAKQNTAENKPAARGNSASHNNAARQCVRALPARKMFNFKLSCAKDRTHDVTGTSKACQCGMLAKDTSGGLAPLRIL